MPAKKRPVDPMRSALIENVRLREPVTFMLVGSAAAFGYFLLACALKNLGLGVVSASAVAYCSFVPISYWSHRRFTFNALGRATVQLPKFVVVSLLGVATGSLAPYLVTDILGHPAWAGFALVCGLVPVVSYVGLRLWVFRS